MFTPFLALTRKDLKLFFSDRRALLTSIAANGATAFLIIMAMTFGLILPRMLFERVLPAPAWHGRSMRRTAVQD